MRAGVFEVPLSIICWGPDDIESCSSIRHVDGLRLPIDVCVWSQTPQRQLSAYKMSIVDPQASSSTKEMPSLFHEPAVDKARTITVVLLVGDDHLREGREGSKDGATDPHGVLTLWWGNNLDLHRRRGKAGDLLLDTLRKALEHSATT